MEQNLGDNNSDSDISDSWIVLNKCSEDIVSPENGHIEASDEDSVEMVGMEKVDIPKTGEEESDGISVISESDVCDNVEAIPILPTALRNGRRVEYESDVFGNRKALPVFIATQRKGKKRKYKSPSGISGCNTCEAMTVLSVSPTKGRKQMYNRTSISKVDTCNYVENFPVINAGPRKRRKDDTCMRMYMHHPNDHINSLLTILLALALAAVVGLGTGHFLGTKELLLNPQETLHQLQQENRMLRNQLQELFKEREQWKRISVEGNFTSSKIDLSSKWLGNEHNFQCFNEEVNLLNQSVGDRIQMSGKLMYTTLVTHSSGIKTVLKHSDHTNNIVETLLFQQPLKVRNVVPDPIKQDHISSVAHTDVAVDSVLLQNIPKYSPEMREYSQSVEGNMEAPKHVESNDETTVLHPDSSEKLADEMKLALASGLELATKLKEALSHLHSVFANRRHLRLDETTSHIYKIDDLGGKVLNKMKHIFYDGGKTQKLLSKTVNRLESMKINVPNKCYLNHLNFYDASDCSKTKLKTKHSSSIIYGLHLPNNTFYKSSSKLYDISSQEQEKKNILKPETTYPSNIVYGPRLSDDTFYKSSSESYDISSREQKNKNILKPETTYSSYISHGLHLSDDMFYKSSSKLYDITPQEQTTLNINNNNYFMSKEEDVHKMKGVQSEKLDVAIVKHITMEDNDSDNVFVTVPREIIERPHSKQQQKKSKKLHTKQKYHISKDQDMTKSQKYWTSNSHPSNKENKKSSYDKKKQKDQVHKSYLKAAWKDSQGKKFYKHKIKFSSQEKEFKHKYKPSSKFERSREFKSRDYNYYKRNNDHDSNMHIRKKSTFYENAYKNMKKFKTIKHPRNGYKFQRPDNRFRHSAWLMDENGYKVNNVSGDWLIKMNQARAKQRENSHKSDWVFDRAVARKMKRKEDLEKARWYFMRARSRENCRLQPHSDWCKSHEDKHSDKFEKDDVWKKNRQFDDNNNDYEHLSRYQRDWKAKQTPKHWKGTKFISQSFKAALNLLKA